MFDFRLFPGTNFNRINLDWIFAKLKELQDGQGTVTEAAEEATAAAEEATSAAAAATQAASDAIEAIETVTDAAEDAQTRARAAELTAARAEAAANTANTAISALDTRLQTAEGNITTLDDNVTDVQGDVAALQNGKVDKVSGKGLSENDFTTALLNKLNGISANAKNVYVRTFTTESLTVAANSEGNVEINVATSGYTPIGIVGITGNGNGGLYISDFYIENNTATLWYRNPLTSSKTFTYNVTVLYIA